MASNDVRARDSDRADVCGLLDAALADGQLSRSEHAARTKSAMNAASFADLDRLVGDLQIPGDMVDAPVVRGVPRRARRWWIPVAAVLAAALLGAGAGCVASTVDEATGPPLPDLTTGPGLAYLLAHFRAEYGSTVTDDLTVYPEYAVFHRSPGNPVRSQYYQFDGDFSTFGSESSRKPSTPTFDIGAVDMPRLAGLLAGAVRSVKIANGRISHVNFQFDPGSDKDPKPYVRIFVNNEAQDSGYMTVAFDGEVLDVRPPNG